MSYGSTKALEKNLDGNVKAEEKATKHHNKPEVLVEAGKGVGPILASTAHLYHLLVLPHLYYLFLLKLEKALRL